MKNKIYILLILMAFTYSSNVTANDNGQGKWYRFTSDFINNCINSIEDSKDTSYETRGKTVSGVNAPVKLSDCISSSPYLDTESQVNQNTVVQGCNSIEDDLFLLPSGSNGQVVEVLSRDNNIKSTFKCSTGRWSIQSVRTVNYIENSCSAVGVNWVTSPTNVTSYSFASVLSDSAASRSLSCFDNLPSTISGGSVVLKSITDMGVGKIKFSCENGHWVKDSESQYQSSCVMNYCQSNTTVSWFDERITNYNVNAYQNENIMSNDLITDFEENEFKIELSSYSMEEDLNVLSEKLVNYNLSELEVSEVLENVVNEVNYTNELMSNIKDHESDITQGGTGIVSRNAFSDDPNLRNLPLCIAKVKSLDGGKTGIADYYKSDTRLFLTEDIAREDSNIVEGKAYFNCSGGRWEINNAHSKALCQ